MMQKYIGLFLLSCCTMAYPVIPNYSPRSQSANAARHIVSSGWNNYTTLCNIDEWHGNFAIVPEYTHSFDSKDVACCLFGQLASYRDEKSTCCKPLLQKCSETGHKPYDSCGYACCDESCCLLNISGSLSPDRGPCDLLADYFGLSTNYKSSMYFKPEISNMLVECNFYLGLDEWLRGLYLEFNAPIVHTWWNLNMSECVFNDGTNDHLPGYFNGALKEENGSYYGIKRNQLINSFTSFVDGGNFQDIDGIRYIPLYYAKMSEHSLKKTSLADMRMKLGWNFLCSDKYKLGINLQSAAPTGNRAEGFYFFEPIVGNGKHWEVGMGLTGRWNLYHNECNHNSMSILLDANITNLLESKQIRTFDLNSRPLSRYMLAAKFGAPIEDLKAGTAGGTLQVPTKQFQGIYEPLANLSTFAVDVSISAQADIVLMLQCTYSQISFDIGYNFWGRTCEDIEPRCDCPCSFESNTWALKGDAFMYGFKALDGAITNTAVALSATQSQATICKGINNPPDGINGLTWEHNPGIDNRKPAWDSNEKKLLLYDSTQSTTIQAYTSLEPKLLDLCDLNIKQSGSKGLSHKVFAHINYTLPKCENWHPYIGIGGEAEFGKTCKNYCNDNNTALCVGWDSDRATCACCSYCSLSQWGVWLKGGIAFY